MVLKRLKGLKEKEEYLEIESGFEEEGKISVRIENLKSYSDTERILQFLRDGNVLFVRIKELRERDINELKKAVERLKKTCSAMDGDLAGVDEDFLVITPKFFRIYRGKD